MLEKTWAWIKKNGTQVATIVIAAVSVFIAWFTYRASIQASRAFVYIQLTGIDKNTAPVAATSDPKEPLEYRRWIFSGQLENTGTTTSNALRYSFGCTTNEAEIFDPRELEKNEVKFSVGPRAKEGSREACVRNQGEVADYMEHTRHLYVYGYVKYRDIFQLFFERDHQTQFCVDIFDFSFTANKDLNAPGQLDARSRPCAQGHNCNDDECS